VWQLDRVRPALSSGVQPSSSPAPWTLETDFAGYNRFRNLFTQDFLYANDATLLTSTYAFFGKAASDWRVVALATGLYQIPSLRNLCFLTSSPSSRDVQPAPSLSPRSDSARSLWMIVPSVNGSMILINAETRDPSRLQSVLAGVSLVTIMFTLNELFTSSISKTTALLLSLTDAMEPCSFLLVVNRPGSYSEVSIGGCQKRCRVEDSRGQRREMKERM
jgi:hypothetical protein